MFRCFVSFLATSAAVWPKPRLVNSGTQTVFLNSNRYSFKAKPSTEELDDAFKRYAKLFFPHPTALDALHALDLDGGLVVHVSDPTTPLSLDADESYVLDLGEDGITVIAAKTVWGALHGLETMSQLIDFDFDTERYSVSGVPIHIEDAPRFPHRGLLIDVGRNFLPVVQLKAVIDSLTYAKMNVLHWHLTEDQSFPMPSRVHPELPKKGAFSKFERYTWLEVADVVKYARLRGIRVIPEFDLPSHSQSWRNSHPEFFTESCQEGVTAFDPANEQISSFLEEVLKDWSDVFPDSYLNLGHDEINKGCYVNPKDFAWRKSMGFEHDKDVVNYFMNRVLGICSKLGRQTILWEEAWFLGKPPKDTVIQVWMNWDALPKMVNDGHRVIYSPVGGYQWGWYLDGMKSTWEAMYALDPSKGVRPEKEKMVIGGEGCMWGENADSSNFDLTTWPRLAAIAERLWSDRSLTSTADAKPRLEVFRCLLLARGVRSGMVGGLPRQPPPGPGSCRQQGMNKVFSGAR